MIIVPVTGLTAIAAWILPSMVDVTAASDRLEVVRIALTVGAGTGGIVALVLGGRRQWSTEQTHKATEHDAIERRITELYTKAVDQLGSEHAAVRLGGLYALERLGNTTSTQQSTTGNIICAYLRMPFTTPAHLKADASEDTRIEHKLLTQELETRRTALEILISHSSAKNSKQHWPALEIRLQRANLEGVKLCGADLSGANLDEANLNHADLRDANLSQAQLAAATLSGAYLANANLERAYMCGADFSGSYLHKANLKGALLGSAIMDRANLSGADLTGADLFDAHLANANFTGAIVTAANFTGAARPFLDDQQRKAAGLPPNWIPREEGE